MDPLFEPDIYQEEEIDEGYSIPKILVAVLLLALIAGGVFYYREHQKYKKTLTYLQEERKKVTQELDAMIQKYNLAIDDNEFLADELKDERDKIIQLKNKVGGLKAEDFQSMSKFSKELKQAQETSSFISRELGIEKTPLKNQPAGKEEPATNKTVTITENPVTQNTLTKPKTPDINKKENNNTIPEVKTGTNTISQQNQTGTGKTETLASQNGISDIGSADNIETSADTENKPNTDTSVNNGMESTAKNNSSESAAPVFHTINTVTIPPTYPGCSGDASAKKRCLITSIYKFISRNFDTGIADDDKIETNKKIRSFASIDIDKYGKVTNIRIRSPYKVLKQEYLRILKKLPPVIPARYKGKNVTTHNIVIPMYFIKNEG